MEKRKSSRTIQVGNDEVLQGVEEERNILHTIKKKRLIRLVTSSLGKPSKTHY